MRTDPCNGCQHAANLWPLHGRKVGSKRWQGILRCKSIQFAPAGVRPPSHSHIGVHITGRHLDEAAGSPSSHLVDRPCDLLDRGEGLEGGSCTSVQATLLATAAHGITDRTKRPGSITKPLTTACPKVRTTESHSALHLSPDDWDMWC